MPYPPIHASFLPYRPIVLALPLFLMAAAPIRAQAVAEGLQAGEVKELLAQGYTAEDLADLVLRDHYTSHDGALVHAFFRQRFGGIEVFNGDIAVHRKASGEVVALHTGAVRGLSGRVNTNAPSITAEQAMDRVLGREGIFVEGFQRLGHAPERMRWSFSGIAEVTGSVHVQLLYLPVDERVVLVWEVEYQRTDGRHW
jgi:hypothetical protein